VAKSPRQEEMAGIGFFGEEIQTVLFRDRPTLSAMNNPIPQHRCVRPGFVLVLLLILFCRLFLMRLLVWWPPISLERRAQRQVVQERVQKIGGWEAVRLGCETLVSNNPDGFQWSPSMSSNWVMHFQLQERYNWHLAMNLDYGPLPPVLAGLRPFRVDYAAEIWLRRHTGIRSS
jgi:hypothetical protein